MLKTSKKSSKENLLLIKNITPVIIAKDAEKTITETLKSLQNFNEVILYLNNSSDKTKEIVSIFSNVKLIEGEFLGFGPTKNKAASYANTEWILSLDSDELLPYLLTEELNALSLNNPNEVFEIKRDNYFLGKEIGHSGWGKDYLVRLYNRRNNSFNKNIVHEYITINESTKKTRLNNSFTHNAVQDIDQFLLKVVKYSNLASKDKKTCSYLTVITKAQFAFFKTYVLQLGFLDGWRGFVIAISNFNGKFFRYTKRFINCKNS